MHYFMNYVRFVARREAAAKIACGLPAHCLTFSCGCASWIANPLSNTIVLSRYRSLASCANAYLIPSQGRARFRERAE